MEEEITKEEEKNFYDIAFNRKLRFIKECDKSTGCRCDKCQVYDTQSSTNITY